MNMPSEPVRAYAYRVLVALQPIATVYGIVDDQKAMLWLGLAAAILGLGLATANTSTSRGD